MKSQFTGNCIETTLDATGQILVTIVTDCICDPSCDICGYYGEAVSGPEDCFSCSEGLVFTMIYGDGSGACTTADESGTNPPTDTSASPPDDGTDDSVSTPPSGGICFMIYQMAGM